MDDDQMYPLYPTSRSVPEPLLLSASRNPGGAARHPNRGFAQPQGGGRPRPNFLRGQAKKRWGIAKGAVVPLVAIFAYFLSHHRK